MSPRARPPAPRGFRTRPRRTPSQRATRQERRRVERVPRLKLPWKRALRSRVPSGMIRAMPTSRRHFLGSIASLGAAAAVSPIAARFSGVRAAGPLHIDADRLRRELEALSTFGRPPGGTFADGVSRIAYSDAEVAARRYVMDLMRGAGLTPRIDAAGNIFAARAVRSRGGAPDPDRLAHRLRARRRQLRRRPGTLAAIEVARAIAASGVASRHPVEVVVWVNEEGVAFGNGLCGSRAAAGELVAGELDQVWNGRDRGDAIRRIGGDPDADRRGGGRPLGSTYLELHIEQGGTLDRERRAHWRRRGDRRHRPLRATDRRRRRTTPARRRCPIGSDALVAAAQLVLAVREAVTRASPGRQVGTVGARRDPERAERRPRRASSAPSSCGTCRPPESGAARKRSSARAREIAARTGTTIAIDPTSHHDRQRWRPRGRGRHRTRGRRRAAVPPACRAAPATTRRWWRGSGRWA